MAALSTSTCRSAAAITWFACPLPAEKLEYVVKEPGAVLSWSPGANGAIAYAYSSPRDAAQLYLKSGDGQARALTNLNQSLLAGKSIAEVESLTFTSNDNRFEVEAFLTKPIGMTATSKHPLIVVIHGGPHCAKRTDVQF